MKSSVKRKGLGVLAVLLSAIFAVGMLSGCAKEENVQQDSQQAVQQKVVLESYGLNLQVQTRHKMIVTETLTVSYPDQIDGITRVIPYEGYRFDPAKNEVIRYRMVLDQINVDTDYSIRREAGKAYLTIGNSADEKAAGGTQIYTLKYRLSCYQDEDAQRDLLYCSLLPYGWENPISSANISVTMPKDFEASGIKLYRYSGGNWVESTVSYTASEKTVSAYLKDTDIAENPELSMQIRLPEGYFKGEKSLTPVRVFFNVLIIVITLGIAALWWFFGRPILREKAATVKKHKLTPIEDAYLLRNTLSITDLAAFLTYWADAGVVRIIQLSAREYSITGLNPPDKGAKNFEFTIYQTLFGDGTKTHTLVTAANLIRRNLGKIKRQVSRSCAALCAGRLYTLESSCVKVAALAFSVVPVWITLAVGGHVALDYSAGYVGAIAAIALLVIHGGIVLLKQNWKNLPKLVRILLAAICGIAEVTVLGGTVYYAASILQFGSEIFLSVIAVLLMLGAALLSGRRSEGYQLQLSQLYAYKRYLKNPEPEEGDVSSFYYRQLPQAYVLRVSKAFSKKCDVYPLMPHEGMLVRGEAAKLSHAAGFYPYYQQFIMAFYRASNVVPESKEKDTQVVKETPITPVEQPKKEEKKDPKVSKGSVGGVLLVICSVITGGLQKLAFWINEGIDWVGDKFAALRGKKEDGNASDEAEDNED